MAWAWASSVAAAGLLKPTPGSGVLRVGFIAYLTIRHTSGGTASKGLTPGGSGTFRIASKPGPEPGSGDGTPGAQFGFVFLWLDRRPSPMGNGPCRREWRERALRS